MQNAINKTWQFNVPPAEVWEYLTNSELLEQWLMKNDFQPVQGHKFVFTTKGGMDHFCEVLDIQPVTTLSYTWKRPSIADQVPFTSTVTWTLIPTATGTELQLVHDGFTAFEDLDAHNKGWQMLVDKMAERVNGIES